MVIPKTQLRALDSIIVQPVFSVGTNDVITGTEDDDNLFGTAGPDFFNMSDGGEDTVTAGAGNDVFTFGATFDAGDKIRGGSDFDSLLIQGTYSGSHAVVFTATTMTFVEAIFLGAGFGYSLTFDAATIPANADMLVDGSSISNSGTMTIDGSHIVDSSRHLTIVGGHGNDILTGGAGNDTFDLTHGGNDTANGGDGIDAFQMGAGLTAADSIQPGNAGATSDVVYLDGDYWNAHAVVFGHFTLNDSDNVTIALSAGHSYSLTLNDGNISGGALLTIAGFALGSADRVIADGSFETNGILSFYGGAGKDTLSGGDMGDFFAGQGGADVMAGGAGADRFFYSPVSDSTGVNHDVLTGVDFKSQDTFTFDHFVAGTNTMISQGTLNGGANFDTSLAAAIGGGLSANFGVLFKPNAGTLAGKIYLIVDHDGTSGYDAGLDYVIELNNPLHLGKFDVTDLGTV